MKLTIRDSGRNVELGTLPAGDDGIAATVAAMQALVDDAISTPALQRAFHKHVSKIAGERGSQFAPIYVGFALYNWLVENFDFVKDPRGIEFIRTPGDLWLTYRVLGRMQGDCDDMATLAAAMIAAVGLSPVLVTVGRVKPGRLEHVFAAISLQPGTLTRETVYAIDAQERTGAGVFPNVARVKLWGMTPTTVPSANTR